jgi:hypothetical protein
MTSHGAGAAALLCLLLLGGCSSKRPDSAVSGLRLPIVYGEPSPAGTVEDAVLLLRTTLDGKELLCSSSLVAKNLVLTARHCLAHLIEGPFNCTVRGALIDNPDGAGRIGLDVPPETLEFYGGDVPRGEPLARGSRIFSTLSGTICVNDVAFVVLDRTVELPVLSLHTAVRARVGESVTLVGYGIDETLPDIVDFRTEPRRRKAGLSLSGVGPDSLEQGVTTVPPRTLVLEGPSACVADSGGPLLDSGTQAIIGVYSLMDGDSCLDNAVRHEFVHLFPFSNLIEEAFAAAGATPVIVPAHESDAAPSSDASADAAVSTSVPMEVSSDGCAIGPVTARGTGPRSCFLILLLASGSWLRKRRRNLSAGLRADRRRPVV